MKAPKKRMWAIISRKGVIKEVFRTKRAAKHVLMSRTAPYRATHYVARVEVQEVKKK